MPDPNDIPNEDVTPEDVPADPSPAPEDEPEDPSPSPDPEPEPDAAPKPDRGKARIERRFREYADKVHSLEQQLAEERRLREDAQRQTPPPAPAERPKEADFDSHEDFLEALADWKAEAKVRSVLEQERRADQERREKAERDARDREAAKRLEEGGKKFGDDFAIVYDTEVENPALVDELKESPHYADLAYHLATHPDELSKLERLSGRALTREVVALEHRLTAKPPQRPPTTTTPPKTLAGGTGKPKALSDPNLGMRDFDDLLSKELGYR
jgi:hypothetical protein